MVNLTLNTGNDVIIESAQSHSSSGSREESWATGIGVGASAGMGGYSVGIQIDGSYSRSERDSWGVQQNNSHIIAGNTVNIISGNDTTIAGGVIYGDNVYLDIGNNLTVQSRQDTGHSEGSSMNVGGSATIGWGGAISGNGKSGGGSFGFGGSESEVAWVTEQSGIYSSNKMDIYVENHTQLDGSVIASGTGDLTLDTGTLGFTTIKDYDRGSAFDMTVGVSASNGEQQVNKYPWMPNNPNTAAQQQEQASRDDKGSPPNAWAGGSIEEHDREQDTNATVGEGTIIIRNGEKQEQDVAALNRDLDKAQVVTKDESRGVEFYASSNAIDGLIRIDETAPKLYQDFVRQLDLLAASGTALADFIANSARDGQLTQEQLDELKRELDSCTAQRSGFNLLDFFVTPAYAAAPANPCDAAVITRALNYIKENKERIIAQARASFGNQEAMIAADAELSNIRKQSAVLQDCVDYATSLGTTVEQQMYVSAAKVARDAGETFSLTKVSVERRQQQLADLEAQAAAGVLTPAQQQELELLRSQVDRDQRYLSMGREDASYQQQLAVYNELKNSDGYIWAETALANNQGGIEAYSQLQQLIQSQIPNNTNRAMGGLQAAGGTVMMVVGAGMVGGTEGAAAVPGWMVATAGVDEFQTGIRQAVSGLHEDSAAYAAIKGSCELAGISDCSTKAAIADFAAKAALAWYGAGITSGSTFSRIEIIASNRVPALEELSSAAQSANRNGLTDAGRALQKHSSRPGSAFSASDTKLETLNREGQAIVDSILRDNGSQFIRRTIIENGQRVTVIDVISVDGRTLRFNSTGRNLIGFREP
ncbi:hemagglutinin repeat-containing protein [Microvirga sp. W0021]|uniref:Hemagglutinin repeat-containing protein n=1 Tax=Hohaiivirga grylli TaxID=3133970 RepID=A0ABV0BM08_9HYPH